MTARPTRILLLTTGLNLGGAEAQLVALAGALRARGWTVHVVSMIEPRHHVAELHGTGVTVASLGMRPGLPDPRALFRLAAEVRRFAPDVVHSHMVHANLLGRLLRPFVSVPVLVCTAHNVIEGGAAREWAYRLTDRLCDLTTNVSRAGVERYVRVKAAPANRIRYVPNGLDPARFTEPLPDRDAVRTELGVGARFTWLCVGRLEAAKNHALLLDAAHLLRTQALQFRLLLVGQGVLESALRSRIAELDLGDTVELLGPRKDVPRLMQACDAFVLSSDWEGLPMVLLEAAASALPIVTTDVGGAAEAVQADVSGKIVPPHDATALAHAMADVMRLPPDERMRLGQAGRAHVLATYTLPAVVSRWEALYRDLYAASARPRVG